VAVSSNEKKTKGEPFTDNFLQHGEPAAGDRAELVVRPLARLEALPPSIGAQENDRVDCPL